MTPTPPPRRPVVILEPSCPCRLPAADHVCGACGSLFDHADLVHVAGGFVCRIPCRPTAVRPGVTR
jgi:hypothetical protein